MALAKPVTGTGRHTVFATARFPRERLAAVDVGPGTEMLVHAKTMGTMTTLCGESTFSWFKFWDVPFANVRADRCPRCTSALVEWLTSGQHRHDR